jgi:hypothetical protein
VLQVQASLGFSSRSIDALPGDNVGRARKPVKIFGRVHNRTLLEDNLLKKPNPGFCLSELQKQSLTLQRQTAWNQPQAGRIDQLAAELATTQRRLAALRAAFAERGSALEQAANRGGKLAALHR